jgi:hypothetical protein
MTGPDLCDCVCLHVSKLKRKPLLLLQNGPFKGFVRNEITFWTGSVEEKSQSSVQTLKRHIVLFRKSVTIFGPML